MARSRSLVCHLQSARNVSETVCGQNAASTGVKVVGLEVFLNAYDAAKLEVLPLRAPRRCAHCNRKQHEGCSHKFVDSKACLKCGWVPPPRR